MSPDAPPAPGEEPRADLVFEGGGVKGIALAGAYRELTDHGYRAACVAGTSAGAITAALVAVGYTGAELEDIVLRQMRFTDFEDRTVIGRVGGGLAEFLQTRGMHTGKYFLAWMRERLEAKGKTTFGHLRDDEATDESRRYRLQVIASDLTARRMLVLPRDAHRLGIDPDDLEIALAVRMSMSIPIFFAPVVAPNPRTGVAHVIVDGGILSNYPIWLFDRQDGAAPEFPTFGMLLVAPGQAAPLMPEQPDDQPAPVADSDLEFVRAIMQTLVEAHDRFYVEQASYARTIPLPTLGVKTTDFAISTAQAQALFDSGRQATSQFLATWNFAAYKAQFRSGPAPSRRQSVQGG